MRAGGWAVFVGIAVLAGGCGRRGGSGGDDDDDDDGAGRDSQAEAACRETMDALLDAADRCGEDVDPGAAADMRDQCNDVTGVRDSAELYGDCLPYLRSAACEDLQGDPACDDQFEFGDVSEGGGDDDDVIDDGPAPCEEWGSVATEWAGALEGSYVRFEQARSMDGDIAVTLFPSGSEYTLSVYVVGSSDGEHLFDGSGSGTLDCFGNAYGSLSASTTDGDGLTGSFSATFSPSSGFSSGSWSMDDGGWDWDGEGSWSAD